MRYRPLSATGDYTIGQPWLVNSPACVAQAILTRLKLWQGQWFLDTSDGTPWLTGVLGTRYGKNPDIAIQQRILGTLGVVGIVTYSSSYTSSTRQFTVNATVQTAYSSTPVAIATVLTSPASNS